MAKKKKFDTNPLDPHFPERAREAETAALPENKFKTGEFPPPSVTEQETRRFDEANFNAYNSPYDGRQVPVNYKHAKFAEMNESSSRKVSKIGLPENILTAVPYIPSFVGLIAGILLLLFTPKSENKVRFHAAQGMAAHIGILIVTSVLGFGHLFGLAGTANIIFQIVTTVMLIIFALKAWRGKPIHIESVDELTNWLEEKIKPRN
ncbi:MAG: DUF4870 domain-containing protein [Pyrinomonadaceae bacterium]